MTAYPNGPVQDVVSMPSKRPPQQPDAGPDRQEPPAALHGRLLQVSRMATIGEMAAGVAHELNQPLAAIANYAQACSRLLGRPGADPAELQQALGEIATQAVRASDIVSRLRRLARSQQSERAPVSVNALVGQIIALVESDARVHGAAVALELADELPDVYGDAGQIQHVILNFVRNALEAMALQPSHAGQLIIRTMITATHEVELAVLDNGPGLAPDARERLFDPFFSTKESGTGMGLAISHTIARLHGGSVGYRPNGPTGACFFILLPADSAA
jgi:two-component system sensor kinase FixL